MKLVVLFLILHIVFLLSQPCRDAFAAPSFGSRTTVVSDAISDPSDGEDGDIDICSPFCICSCCALTVGTGSLPTAIFLERPFVLKPVQVTDGHRSLSPEVVVYPIWQPPKL